MEGVEGPEEYIPEPDSLDPVMEAERPCCYKEFIGPKECWDQIGMRIRWTHPEVPGEHVPPSLRVLESHMHDPLPLRLSLECKKPVPINEVTAYAWTHCFHKDNHEGIYREIPLHYDETSRKWDDQGVTRYEFRTSILPTHNADFRLTFNVKFRDYMLWVDKYKSDNVLTVKKVRQGSDHLETFQQTQVTRKIYMGNYLAMLLADEMNYDSVINLDHMAEELLKPLMYSKSCRIMRMCKELQPGAGNTIPEGKIAIIVEWLKTKNKEREKILVGDFCGLGRVGSALAAYIYANNPNLTFDEAYQYVRKRKPSVFCHKGLRDTVAKLYPRD